jgi:hypothetical protein
MIPNDLTGFSTEQLRGFATGVDRQIAALRAEARDDAEKLSTLETLLDERDTVQAALAAAEEADAADDAVDDAVTADTDGGEGDDEDEPTESDDDAGDGDGDADAAVDEAVASATLGGGTGPRVTGETRHFDREEVRSFLRNTTKGKLTGEGRVSFGSVLRETNHVVSRGADATEAIKAAIKDRAAGTDRTAAGCFCGPDDARTAIAQALVDSRPLSDTLPTVTGGDFRFIRQIDLADALTGVTIWDCADQAAVDPETISTWKPCFELDCETEVTSQMYAVPACASFSVQALIGNPALIDNLEHVMTVAYNQVAELQVYAQLLANASQVVFPALTTGYGASAQLLREVGWAMETIRATHRDRLDYTLAIPAGLRERILTDGLIRGIDDYRTWSDLTERLAELGVTNIVEMYDPTTAPSALPAPGGPPVAATVQPLAQQILLYRPDNFVLGVAPELDLGITRSPELARQNKQQWFVESFESVTRVGIQPTVAITSDLCANGIRPALGEGDDCVVEVA